MWLVFEQDTNELIGRIGFENLQLDGWNIEDTQAADRIRQGLDSKILMAELGYLVSRQYRKQGIAAEVCAALMDFFNGRFGLEDVYIRIEPGNTASVKLAEKLGFQFISRIKKSGNIILLYQYPKKERKSLEIK